MREVWVVERRDDDSCCFSVAAWGCVGCGFPTAVFLFLTGNEPMRSINEEFNIAPECLSVVITTAPVGRRIGYSLVRAAEKAGLDPIEAKPSRRGRFSPRRFGMAMIGVYRRHLSPRLPIRCPYRPSCSAYGYEAIKRYGMIQGTRIILHRLSRCSHTIFPGTHDPLP